MTKNVPAVIKTWQERAQEMGFAGCCPDTDSLDKLKDAEIADLRAAQAAPIVAASELERAVLDMARMLAANEWAEHVSDHPASALLEAEITRLVGRVAPAAQQPAEGAWIANTGEQPVADDVLVEVVIADEIDTDAAGAYLWAPISVGRIIRWRPAAPTQAEGQSHE